MPAKNKKRPSKTPQKPQKIKGVKAKLPFSGMEGINKLSSNWK
jgi:hypothetical protein